MPYNKPTHPCSVSQRAAVTRTYILFNYKAYHYSASSTPYLKKELLNTAFLLLQRNRPFFF